MGLSEQLIEALKMLGKCSFNKNNIKMSQGELAILNSLKIYGPLTPTKLCEITTMSSAHTAKTINALKSKDEVIRVVSDDDKRKALISLTEKGEDKINRLYTAIRAQFEELVTYLGEADTTNLIRIIYKISNRNEVK